MTELTGSSPLEFHDDYFNSNISSDDYDNDDDVEHRNSSDNISFRNTPKLRKTVSMVTISDSDKIEDNKSGILFNNLRTTPTNGINLENVNLNHFKKLNSNIDDDISSIVQPDDTLSTVNTIQTSILNNSENDILENAQNHSNNAQINKNEFPFKFDNELEFSDNSSSVESFFQKKQHFFILSSSGKPIYSMHGSNDIFMIYSGIIQTIVSFYKYSNKGSENIKIIESQDFKTGKPIKFIFLDKSPIILMSIIKFSETTCLEIEQQLDFLYSFILATLTKPYIDKIFNKYANFDLRNLLGTSDILTLDSICNDLSNNLNVSQVLGGLQCLKMHSSIRNRLDTKLLNFKSENLLYALIVGPDGKLISIMRQRRHNLHTSDLMILFEMIFNTNTFKSSNENRQKADNSNENLLNFTTKEIFWVPICMPKFNQSGHLYSLIQFHQLNDERLFKLHDIKYSDKNYNLLDEDETKVGIILITPYKDLFNDMRQISSEISKLILLDSKIYKDLWNSLVGSGKILVEKIIKTDNAGISKKLPQSQNSENDSITMKTAFSDIINKFNFGINMDNNNNYIKSSLKKDDDISNSIIHFAIKYKKLAECIFPNSNKFNINDKNIRKNLLSVYKYIRRKLQILLSDSSIINLNNSNETNNNKTFDFMNIDNKMVYENWINKETDERINGFGCNFGLYEIFIISKGVINEEEMFKYSLKIMKWCKIQENRLFISSGCIF